MTKSFESPFFDKGIRRIGERALLRPFGLRRAGELGNGEWDVAIRVFSVATKSFASPFYDEGIRGSGDQGIRGSGDQEIWGKGELGNWGKGCCDSSNFGSDEILRVTILR